MRGLDPRIHTVAGADSARCDDVDRPIKSGHHGSGLYEARMIRDSTMG